MPHRWLLRHSASDGKVVPERLALRRLDPGHSLYRCHPLEYGAIHFGRTARNRFDDPQGGFGVCYFSLSPVGAFAETLIRRPTGQVLQKSDLLRWGLTTVQTRRGLSLLHCHGAGLKRNGLDSRISSTVDRRVPQSLARVFHEHPDGPDGLLYRARHDDDQLSVALFERASDKLAAPGPSISWMQAGPLLGLVLDRYGIALIDA